MTIAYSPTFDQWMEQALAKGVEARASEDVPVGALLLDSAGSVVASARNEREATHDPTAHAEVLAIRRAAAAWGSWMLPSTTLVVTLEPCLMCAGALLAARVPRLIFGAWDPKAGACGSVYDVVRDRRLNHQLEVIGGVSEERCATVLHDYFASLR